MYIGAHYEIREEIIFIEGLFGFYIDRNFN